MAKPQLFHCLRYTDTDQAIEFLEALGFTRAVVVRDPDDDTLVAHAQLNWRDNGGVMLGSTRPGDDDTPYRPGVCNLVVEDNGAVDRLLERAVSAGATVIQPPTNPPHSGRTGCVADFDGNWWNLDSYQGA